MSELEFFTREDINPCPFCGEKTIYYSERAINCPSCQAMIPNELKDIEEMIEVWNYRVPMKKKSKAPPADSEQREKE